MVNKIFSYLLTITFVLLILLGIYVECISDKQTNTNIQVKDSIEYNIIKCDSIEYNIIKKDSIIYNLKIEMKYEIEKVNKYSDSASVELFNKLCEE